MRYLLIDPSGKAVNAIELEEGAKWEPPAGHIIVKNNPATDKVYEIGSIWNGKRFIAPVEPKDEPKA